ncbi:MAG TPA: glycosyltransferase family 39 protein [Isosphaeraceae bacterium]
MDPPGSDHPSASRRTSLLGGLGVAAATLALMIATEPRLAIVMDEGYTLGREARVRDWLRAMRDPASFARSWRPVAANEDLVQQGWPSPPPAGILDSRGKLLSPRAMSRFWPFAREEPHGHPPFYAIVGLAGDVLAPSWAPLPRARLGPMIAFSLTGGALFTFLARRRGLWAGAAAVGAWASQPRLFAHGHYAHYDALLACLWVGSILAFLKAVEPDERPSANPRWGWVVVFGLLAGAAAATKLTGWFLPLPFVAWALLARDRRAGRALTVGGIVAVLTTYLLIQPWWGDPLGGVEGFLGSNLTRGRTTYIPTQFLGQIYLTPQGSLPWYNTLLWTAFVTPVGFLALAIAGAGWAVRNARARPIWTLVVVHWAALLILRALPHTPGHDAERQFLPAFGCLAICAGLGAAWIVERLGRWGKALVAAAIAEGAASVALMMPVPLSYYSPLVGGLPGAARLGMEPTYYWDALSDAALDRLNRGTAPGESVLFPVITGSLRHLAQTGKLRPGLLDVATAEHAGIAPAWYVVQNRPGAFTPQDRALVARAKPEDVLVSKWGVPLIWAFPRLEPPRP